jgi:hypothetical protein
MNYNGKPLHKLSKQELISLCEQLADRIGSADDLADLLKWQPPKISGVAWKGKGSPGGK